ncbi:DUF7220 family protein [Blastochloris tepida]|uniref:Uncharacterized protein n=1 Tax=Blastochloris tepida TaxID=2233851 RepID=A0A348G1C5_9HYPH|nr:hypothetical protein [Blastochloris tepida]BBF93358.1 hypothetical protein BLTE_20430 [Blastochloris tepida]
MKQSRAMSLLESIVNILVGLGVAMAANAIILPLLGFAISLQQNLQIAAFMTVVSILRSYALRRLFEALHIRHPISPFMLAVMAERRRQIEVEGWSPEHDDGVLPGSLAAAGASYALEAPHHLSAGGAGQSARPPESWPWSRDWWKPTGFRRDLVKAGALIIAEGEKFDRRRGDRNG